MNSSVHLTDIFYVSGGIMGRHKRQPVPIIERDWYNAIPAMAASRIFPVSYSTLIRWANEEKIAAWRPGKEWFVSVLSLIRLCGKPQDDTELLELLPDIM